MKVLWKIMNVIIVFAILPQFSCDDRVPESSIENDYKLSLEFAHPYNIESSEIVVEDLVSPPSIKTHLQFKLIDESNNKPVPGKLISFSAKRQDSSYGSFDINPIETNEDGLVEVYYEDGGDTGAVSDNFDGVVVTAKYSTLVKKDAKFNVYPNISSVWPYNFILNANPDIISLDDGQTTSNITLQVRNKLSEGVRGLRVNFSSDKGFIESSDTTNQTGNIDLIFRDQGQSSDGGLATIQASYSHPVADQIIVKNVTVQINANYNFSMTASHLSGGVVVGEDVITDDVVTYIEGTLTDSASGNPIQNEWVFFTAYINNMAYGTFSLDSVWTGSNGTVSTEYYDGGEGGAVDIENTNQIFEGVTIKAKTAGGDTLNQVQFNVYPSISNVWPYNITMSASPDEIMLGNDETSTINIVVRNKLYDTVKNIDMTFESNKGFIEPTATTDSDGNISLTFTDQSSTDVGRAIIKTIYVHPAINDTINDSVFISIDVNYIINLTSYPIAQTVSGSDINIGEDIVGESAHTIIIVEVTKNDSTGSSDPVSGINVNLTPMDYFGDSIGTITKQNSVTNNSGRIFATYNDDGQPHVNNPATDAFDIWEGVTIVASFSEDPETTIKFNVYDSTDVWPYTLTLIPPDTTVIYLDGGITSENFTARLRNSGDQPVSNVMVSFFAVHGSITSPALTDSAGTAEVTYSDLGFYPPDTTTIWVDTVTTSFYHPGFGVTLTSSTNMTIEDNSFSSCAYLTIPTAIDTPIIVVQGGFGQESATIHAKIFDDDDNLIDFPVEVQFTLEPYFIPDTNSVPDPSLANDLNGDGESTIVYTLDGIAEVSVNSGIQPGPVRIKVEVDCDLDGDYDDLVSVAVPVIVAADVPKYLSAIWSPFPGTGILSPIDNGGLNSGYRAVLTALVYDQYYNAVLDTTYVYWTLVPFPLYKCSGDEAECDPNGDPCVDGTECIANDIQGAFVEGVSFTNNELSVYPGDAHSGVAYSEIIYNSDNIGETFQVKALTYGVNGEEVWDFVGTTESLEDTTIVLPFYPGQLMGAANPSFINFAPFPDYVLLESDTVRVQGILQDVSGTGVGNVEILVSAPYSLIIEWLNPGADNIIGTDDDTYEVLNPGLTDQNGEILFRIWYANGVCVPNDFEDVPCSGFDCQSATVTMISLLPQSVTSETIPIGFARSINPADCAGP